MTYLVSKPFTYDGDVIREKNAIEGLSDGNIYIVCERTDQFVDAMTNAKNHLFTAMDNTQLFNRYDLKVIEDISQYTKAGKLFDAVMEHANVIIPLTTPNVTEKQYLVNRVKYNEVDLYLPSMILKAENISKTSIEEALMNLAMFEPSACSKLLNSIHPNDEDAKGLRSSIESYIGGPLLSMAECAMPMAPMAGMFTGAVGTITYQQSREIFGRFVDNCATLRKAEKKTKFSAKFQEELDKAKYEIDYVFNTIWGASKNMDSLRKIIINQSDKKLAESFDNFLNKEKMANESNISILIEKSDKGIDKYKKNDGNYRVFAFDGKNKVQVHFARKSSCIIYMMYLMDKKKRGEDVDFLKISKNKEIFCKLYTEVYGSSAEEVFIGLTSKIIKGEVRRTSLRDCYVDIQKSLKKVIDDLGEEVPPFVIPNEDSHLSLRLEKISIPLVFKEVSFLY